MRIFTYNNLLESKSIDGIAGKSGQSNSGPTGKNRPLLSPDNLSCAEHLVERNNLR